MYPEDLLKILKQNIKPQWKTAFRTAFCTGLLIHLFRLTNHLLTWDSVYNFHSDQNAIHLGRCFLTLSCGIGSYYDLQWINGLLSLLYLSFTAVCLTEIFSLRNKTTIFFLSALTVSFPVVASTFAYMYTADGYFLAQLFVTFAVVLTLYNRKGFLPGMLLIALAYGSYQAYISYAAMLILVWSILRLMEERPVRTLLPVWGRFLLMGGMGTGLYLLCNKLLSAMQNAAPSSYNGIATMGLPGADDLLPAVKNGIIDFVYFFFGPLDKCSLFQILNACLFLLLLLLFLFIIRQEKLYQRARIPRLLMILLCLSAMPFVCFMIYFISPGVRYYMLMYAGLCLIYMLPALLWDKMSRLSLTNAPKPFSPALLLSWGCFLITALHIFNFALIDNISYLYMTASNTMTFDLASRMTDRIEQLADYPAARKLCIAGHFDDYDTISFTLPPAMAGIRDSYLLSESAHFSAMMDTYFGLSLEPCDKAEREAILASKQFAEMACWPAAGSVRQIGDTVVIKITENGA